MFLSALKGLEDEFDRVSTGAEVVQAQLENTFGKDRAKDLLAYYKQLGTQSKEAYEKAKRDLAQPAQLPNRRVAAAPPPEAPKSLDEAFDQAGRDPEILATMQGYTP